MASNLAHQLVQDVLAVQPAVDAQVLEVWLEPAIAQLTSLPRGLAAALARHLPEALAEPHAADLLLAAACVCQDPPSLLAFDSLLVKEVARTVRPLDSSPTFLDEVTQLVRERLLVKAPGREAMLADYAGLGSLSAWLRAVSMRVALNARRPHAREAPVSSVPEQPLADPDPELQLLQKRYREEFRAAFATAIAALSARERTLLRLTSLDGLTLAQVGPMYGKDASTISRWLLSAREQLLSGTRAALSATLQLSTTELDSVMRAADSELNLSLSRLLESR